MVSREELHRLVWSKPMTELAEQFGVSGSYMVRVCDSMNVPRPRPGYWSKLVVGKAPSPEPLPKVRPGDLLNWEKGTALPTGHEKRPPRPSRRASKREPAPDMTIPRRRVHSMIYGAREHFENSRPIEEGAYLRPFKQLLVDVTASKASLEKALDFANDLFNAFQSAGHHVRIAPADLKLARASVDEREVRKGKREYDYYNRLWSPLRPTIVCIGDIVFGLAIVEMSEEALLRHFRGKYMRESEFQQLMLPAHRVGHTWTTTRRLPCGRLRLIAYSPYRRIDWSTEWQETTSKALSPQIRSIVKAIEAAATEMPAKLKEAERQAEIERLESEARWERWNRQEDQRRIKQSEKESEEQLSQIIRHWADVMNVESFLAGVEQRAVSLPDADRDPVLERLRLAREYLGSQDPLDFFMGWKAPSERYQPRYPKEPGNVASDSQAAADGNET